MWLLHFFRIQLNSVIELLSNTIWLLSAEFVAKISRIFTIIVLAAQLSPMSYGTAMLALAFHDVFGLLLRAGVGSQIINCKPHQLENFAKNGIVIQWGICLTIAIGQFSSANYLSSLYDNDDITVLLQTMAIIYLLYPWVSIKIFLLQRENKMRWFSIRNGLCVIIENCTIAIAALLGADILSVALGKVAFSIFWLLLFSFSPVKSYGIGCKPFIIHQMLQTSGKLFNTEFLRGIRLHADTFIAGRLLTPELFGFYTFAKNAGVGLSQSISQVYIGALFPYLCKLERKGQLLEQQKKVFVISLGIGFLFVIQALLAPIYVPILFDEKWSSAIPIITILCLVALPNLIIDIVCCMQRVTEQYHRETFTRLVCLFISLATLFIFTPNEPMEFALVIFFSSLFCLIPIYLINVIKPFSNNLRTVI
ncbi:oligosaccharide flippase family protein [Colwellia psychrerythraea]|uniref:Polysaccharide biosynthesis protein n=1 Tax=Colwellia psychrerythraea (strain 34H / ATCC BAA-681) TaxID=167879 RepID=Q47Z36_COLP3|nr:oligosaccharide flippase family protein [Colwellia psychrerythraea]AAZ25823.1 polysaccharide biosynthesis protein [Colwellia psychrerythraea 34H]